MMEGDEMFWGVDEGKDTLHESYNVMGVVRGW